MISWFEASSNSEDTSVASLILEAAAKILERATEAIGRISFKSQAVCQRTNSKAGLFIKAKATSRASTTLITPAGEKDNNSNWNWGVEAFALRGQGYHSGHKL